MTLQLLWFEYKDQHPDGYQHSQFCERYRLSSHKLDVVMRQNHRAGERVFVDYAGLKVPITDPRTGQVTEAPVFVATLGASSYTYVEATAAEDLRSFIGAHCRAFEFFGGVPEVVVPDNAKTGVTHPCRYEPDLNPTYLDMASFYGTAVIRTRSAHPRDKAKVESAVGVVERRVLAPLRSRTFFSLAELDRAIGELVDQLNRRPFQKLDGSRLSRFEELDRPALRVRRVEPRYPLDLFRQAGLSLPKL